MSTELTTFNADDHVNGIDVFHNNGTIDWENVAAAGVSFAFAKATEGETFRDPKFNANYTEMKNNGIIRGAYHFFRPNKDGRKQAENFLKLVQALGPGDLPPSLDVEGQ
jgi:lysozyme